MKRPRIAVLIVLLGLVATFMLQSNSGRAEDKPVDAAAKKGSTDATGDSAVSSNAVEKKREEMTAKLVEMAELTKKTAALAVKMMKVKDEMASLTVQIDADSISAQQIADLKKKRAKNKEEMATLTKEMTGLTAAMAGLTEQMNALTEEMAELAKEELSLEMKIDKWFGKYIVKPSEKVLFYDFGSADWEWTGGTKIPLVVVWLSLGAIFFTIRMGFINFRGFIHAIKLTRGDYDDPSEVGEVSHFQALASALSATVGLGNIAGVAIAISLGGPGACFWIVIVGLIGMSSKFAECTLGQMYRKVAPDGTVSGGPMHYLSDGLAEMGLGGLGKVLALMFTVLCIGASFGGGNAFQIVQSLGAIKAESELIRETPIIYGIIMATLVGVVIIGGIKRIGSAAGRIVPFMCTAYVLTAVYIILSNPTHIIPAFQTIINGAFSDHAMYGGFLGVMVIGIKRAVFSNEAGVGSAAIAHSAAKTDEPISEGIVALLEPFIDTVVICTITALLITITGVYNDPANATLIAQEQGAALTSLAFSGEFGVWWFKYILIVAVVMFAFSTLISWSYYGERCWTRLFGPRSSLIYKILFLICTVLGSIVSAKNVLVFSDLMILAMAFPNILGAVLLSGKIKERLDEYWRRYKAGELERH